MAADRRTPVTKGPKPAVKKTPANAAAASAVAAAVKVEPVKVVPAKAPAVKAPAAVKASTPVKVPTIVKAPALAKVIAPKANAAKVAIPSAMTPSAAAPALKPAKGDYALEDQVGFHLRRAHQRATMIFNDVMGRFDITPTQFAALAKIDDEGAISQNHLGRLTAMDPSTILGVVGRLQRQGLVHLRSTPGDARLTLIELTLDGQKRVADMKAVAADVSKRTMVALDPDEAKTLNELLARIC